MRLIINGYLIPLENSDRLAQTKQVNNLLSLNSRQTNITNAYKVPRTSYTEKAFGRLGIIGNKSGVPYQVNSVYLYSDYGECFISNGKCLVLGTFPEYYNIQLIDGNVDMFKAIEGKKLGELPLTELNHLRSVDSIIDSWYNDRQYKYIVSDFNGKTMLDPDTLNADYLTPFVSIPYLWNKIHEFYGFQYEGEIFDSPDFKDLWLSYPKGLVPSEGVMDLVFESNEFDLYPTSSYLSARRFEAISATFSDLENVLDTYHLQVKDSGNYRLTVSGLINMSAGVYIFGNLQGSTPIPFKMSIGKNQQFKGGADAETPDFKVLAEVQETGIEFEISVNFQLDALDTINFMCKNIVNTSEVKYIRVEAGSSLSIKLEVIEGNDVDFEKALIDFETKSFMSEIIQRLALVPMKDKYTNLYRYYTLNSILDNENPVDWSDKFSDIVGESYVYESYARQNYLRYKYNDKEGDYNDGFLIVDNENLPEKTNIFISSTYSPENLKTSIFTKVVNTYKMWDKTIKDDATIEYKPLDKRFYITKSINDIDLGTKSLKSEYTGDTEPFEVFPVENFSGLDFSSLISANYTKIGNIINRSLIINASFNLSDKDVSEIDFSRCVYVKQLGGSFIVNKISNYISGKKVNVELIKVIA